MSDHDRIFELGQRIAQLERKVEFLLSALRLDYQEPAGDPWLAQIGELLRRGQKIEAIKLYREWHNVGLAEAKTAVDQIERRLTG
jgi:ribosomal protein L7/L12